MLRFLSCINCLTCRLESTNLRISSGNMPGFPSEPGNLIQVSKYFEKKINHLSKNFILCSKYNLLRPCPCQQAH